VTIGSLDAPDAAHPVEQFGIESELPGSVGSERYPPSVPKTKTCFHSLKLRKLYNP
jgi:hypothetical protein